MCNISSKDCESADECGVSAELVIIPSRGRRCVQILFAFRLFFMYGGLKDIWGSQRCMGSQERSDYTLIGGWWCRMGVGGLNLKIGRSLFSI